ncbi:MAG: flavodoxin family protein [Sedimentisphaerales bacterium]|nr:flavodoxin family protein [Sedimentisphaerales bacterium]
MKKILAVVGSPRKNGNTHILVSKIAEGAKSKDAEVDALFLDDFTIKECNGCHVCWKMDDCVRNDDMINIYPRIIKSDVIIFGTPVYWYGPTAIMKGFIDRFVYFNCPKNRPKIQGKSAVIAVPFEEENQETVRPVVEFFQKCLDYLQINLVGKIIVPGVTTRGEVRNKENILQKAYELGQSLA